MVSSNVGVGGSPVTTIPWNQRDPFIRYDWLPRSLDAQSDIFVGLFFSIHSFAIGPRELHDQSTAESQTCSFGAAGFTYSKQTRKLPFYQQK